MKKMLLTRLVIIVYTFVLLFVVGCSTESTKSDSISQDKNKSTDTQKEFEAIENAPVKRSANLKPGRQHQKMPQPRKDITIEIPKVEHAELNSDTPLNTKAQERLQEINQNLAFYCMKHRSDPVFSTEEKCLTFTKVVLNDCEKKHKIINTVMVNCIKDLLKKRH